MSGPPFCRAFRNVPILQPQALAISAGPHGLSEGRGFIERALAAAGFDADLRYQITVATNEAVSNAMEHGEPCDDGQFHLAATVESGSFVFSVRDCGEFETAASPMPDPVAERGRGFAFMNLLMDDVRLDARADGTGACGSRSGCPGHAAARPRGRARDRRGERASSPGSVRCVCRA